VAGGASAPAHGRRAGRAARRTAGPGSDDCSDAFGALPAAARRQWATDTIKILAEDDPDAAAYRRLAFEQLSDFEYDPPAAWDMVRQAREPGERKRFVVLSRIQRLSGRKVAVEGFMMPLDFDRGSLTSFVPNGSYDMCAFGMLPTSPNEWIDVRMAGGRRTRFTGHFPVTVFGGLEVGPLWDTGRVTSLDRMDADFLGIDGSQLGD
jgi:hypothetical protein